MKRLLRERTPLKPNESEYSRLHSIRTIRRILTGLSSLIFDFSFDLLSTIPIFHKSNNQMTIHKKYLWMFTSCLNRCFCFSPRHFVVALLRPPEFSETFLTLDLLYWSFYPKSFRTWVCAQICTLHSWSFHTSISRFHPENPSHQFSPWAKGLVWTFFPCNALSKIESNLQQKDAEF